MLTYNEKSVQSKIRACRNEGFRLQVMDFLAGVIAVSGDVRGAAASVVVALRTAAGRRLFSLYQARKGSVPFNIVSRILRLRQLHNVLKFGAI